ncbi:hypothetical protein H1P_1280001 [Hyella patelloides LEGE 07179]|uniref:BDLP-like helical domain-containing protein n=1 Tax=Hyella patelloides LEGE 07179 TaxID=945734 RepID=A0A563VKE3_9CYAN|nr:hypothetical protein [Hyella patelloides]VEP11946.1 hypothetical protein H1P_1280001 [Hyella patelloides LEGE 07179]
MVDLIFSVSITSQRSPFSSYYCFIFIRLSGNLFTRKSLGVARQDFLKFINYEFRKYLPKIAQEQKEAIQDTVATCFDNYQRELVRRINNDIESRKTELHNLVTQQSNGTSDRQERITKLQQLDAKVLGAYQKIKSIINLKSS